jgi:hypothetical protein
MHVYGSHFSHNKQRLFPYKVYVNRVPVYFLYGRNLIFQFQYEFRASEMLTKGRKVKLSLYLTG